MTTLLTPNAPEAARLTGLKISSPADLEAAARRLQALGPRWVLAKGGHLPGDPVDVLTDGNNRYHLPGVRLAAPNHTAPAVSWPAPAAAGLAQGLALPEAVNQARSLTRQALKYGLPLGRGSGPVNPYAPFARELARFAVLADLQAAQRARLQAEDLSPLIPEVMTNLGLCHPLPRRAAGCGGLPGPPGEERRRGCSFRPPPAFGASRHVAAIILTALATHPELRSAMNIRYVEGIEDLAPLLHLHVASFDRAQEPADGQSREGGTLAWGVASVLEAGRPAPDIIYDRGEVGKEAMIRILGPSPMAVAEKALAIKQALQAGGKL